MRPRLFVLFAALCAIFWLRPAWAQECITCRTEACPQKATLREWCGKPGADPLSPRAPVKRKPRRPGPTAVAPPAGPAVPATVLKTPPAPTGPPPPETVTPPLPPTPPAPPVNLRPELHAEAPAAATLVASPAPRRRPLRAAGWAVLGAGVGLAAAGATLWAIDSTPTCGLSPGDLRCPRLYDTQTVGIALTVAGGAALVSAVIMLVSDARAR